MNNILTQTNHPKAQEKSNQWITDQIMEGITKLSQDERINFMYYLEHIGELQNRVDQVLANDPENYPTKFAQIIEAYKEVNNHG